MKIFLLVIPTQLKQLNVEWSKWGYSQSDLAKVIGLKSRASEILSTKRKLTLEIIRQLHKVMMIPTDVLIQDD